MSEQQATYAIGGREAFGSDITTGFADAVFRTKKKHKLREVAAPEPALEHAVADTHVHLSMLRDPVLSLARAGVHGMGFVCCMANPAEDAQLVYDQAGTWFSAAHRKLENIAPGSQAALPSYRIACGCHPHDAKDYDAAMEQQLRTCLSDVRTCCLGEIGLDYHYDYSPRDVQRDVFRRQVALAHEAGLPIALHLREAHDEALEIMDEEGFPEAGTILHCFNLGPDVLAPWVERGCYIAIGGAVTFGSSDDVRAALPDIPKDRFLFETDGPFMAPTPFRGCECGPELAIFTAEFVAEQLGHAPGAARAQFLQQVYANSTSLLDRGPTIWQSNTQ